MYTIHGIGLNRPVCKSRQFSTMGIIKQSEDIGLKPENLGSEHFKLLNNFGLQQQILMDKRFVDINNCVNQHQSKMGMVLDSSHINSFPNTDLPKHMPTMFNTQVRINYRDSNHSLNGSGGSEIPMQKTSRIGGDITSIQSYESCDSTMCNKWLNNDCERSQHPNCVNIKLPKKVKKSTKMQVDKINQKSTKKYKKSKNYSKQSKRESDRAVLGSTSCTQKKRRKIKPWHKKSLELEIIDFDETYINSDQINESPVTSPLCSIGVPTMESSICIPYKICKTSPPVAIEFNCEPYAGSSAVLDCVKSQQLYSPKQTNFRIKLPSECESEDSFIIFEENKESSDLDDDTENTDFDQTSDSESDDSAVLSCSIESLICDQIYVNNLSPTRKVRFAAGKDLCEIHPMVQWSFAYQKARKGPWEQYALDRMRFKNRVSRLEPILTNVLQPAHRNKVYSERFSHCD